MLKEAILKLREDVLVAAQENEQRTMQKCAQTLMAATGLKMLQGRMEKTALSPKKLRQASDKAYGYAMNIEASPGFHNMSDAAARLYKKRTNQVHNFKEAAREKTRQLVAKSRTKTAMILGPDGRPMGGGNMPPGMNQNTVQLPSGIHVPQSKIYLAGGQEHQIALPTTGANGEISFPPPAAQMPAAGLPPEVAAQQQMAQAAEAQTVEQQALQSLPTSAPSGEAPADLMERLQQVGAEAPPPPAMQAAEAAAPHQAPHASLAAAAEGTAEDAAQKGGGIMARLRKLPTAAKVGGGLAAAGGLGYGGYKANQHYNEDAQ